MRADGESAIDLCGCAPLVQGGAGITRLETGLRLLRAPTSNGRYANAQIDDHRGRRRGDFPWKPPLRLEVRARFSHDGNALQGTAGFGFWNDPFGMAGTWPPVTPQVTWFFFASPPSQMALALDAAGHGFKAAVLDCAHWAFYALLPFALPGMRLMRWPRAERRLWPLAQRVVGADERALDVALGEWHTYSLLWQKDGVRFEVDGVAHFETERSPRGPLGLVAWIDNQYLVATRQGRLAHGVVNCSETQWMEIVAMQIVTNDN